jgi:hypothetical protein
VAFGLVAAEIECGEYLFGVCDAGKDGGGCKLHPKEVIGWEDEVDTSFPTG